MKQFKFFLMAALCSVFVLSSCSDDDSLSRTPPIEIVKAFNEMFPNATNVSWTTIDDYDVARFYDAGTRAEMMQPNCTAWFSRTSNRWSMTDREIPFSSLPAAVRSAFESSVYAQSPWTVDDEANVLERAGSETFYVIEVDKNENGTETDVDLYYTLEGKLVDEVIGAPEDDNHIDFVPEQQPMTPREFIADRYPARALKTAIGKTVSWSLKSVMKAMKKKFTSTSGTSGLALGGKSLDSAVCPITCGAIYGQKATMTSMMTTLTCLIPAGAYFMPLRPNATTTIGWSLSIKTETL